MDLTTIKKLFSILEKPFKRQAYLLQFYLIIGVLFESMGLGMLIPLVTVITDVNSSDQNFFIRFIKGFSGNIPNSQLVFIVLICFVLFYILKTIFLSFLVWKQSEFTLGLSRNISTRLYRGYLSQPYAFFLDKNSAILMRNIGSEVGSVTAYVQAVMYLQTEVSVLIGIVVTLFFLEPFGAMVVFCFVGGVSYLLFSFSKKKLTLWGKERQKYDGIRSKNLLEGLNGFTELKLFNKQDFFLRQYDAANRSFWIVQRKVQFMQQVQRYYLELVLITSIALLAVAVIVQGKTIALILPSLSLFLFAALRMLPSANRIISSLQSMRFVRAGVDLLHKEFEMFRAENEKPLPANKPVTAIHELLHLENISFTYPYSQHKTLTDITLDIRTGSVIGIIGQSGSGKTTVVNILTGLLQPASGKILIDDLDITDNTHELRKFIGYVPQTIFLIDDSLKRNIAFGIPDEAIDPVLLGEVIAAAQLDTVVDRLPDGVNTMVGERGIKLSGGQRQRIGIARALYNRPSILILDEGTSALDTDTENFIMESVANLKGKLTIVLVAHRYSTLHFCDIVYKMHNGHIIGKGKLEELI